VWYYSLIIGLGRVALVIENFRLSLLQRGQEEQRILLEIPCLCITKGDPVKAEERGRIGDMCLMVLTPLTCELGNCFRQGSIR
jgi:hypothetical protein